jgi:hypothetical protein
MSTSPIKKKTRKHTSSPIKKEKRKEKRSKNENNINSNHNNNSSSDDNDEDGNRKHRHSMIKKIKDNEINTIKKEEDEEMKIVVPLDDTIVIVKKEEKLETKGLDTDNGDEKDITIMFHVHDSSTIMKYPIERKFAYLSEIIEVALTADKTENEYPILCKSSYCTTAAMDKIIEYLNLRKGVAAQLIPKPLTSKIMKDLCKDEADAKYIEALYEQGGRPLYFDVLKLANYLGIQCMVDNLCAKLSAITKGRAPEVVAKDLRQGTVYEHLTEDQMKVIRLEKKGSMPKSKDEQEMKIDDNNNNNNNNNNNMMD